MIFVMVKCCVFFAVRTEFLNIIQTNFGLKGLVTSHQMSSVSNSVHVRVNSAVNAVGHPFLYQPLS
jgi:hypothetical protein